MFGSMLLIILEAELGDLGLAVRAALPAYLRALVASYMYIL